MGAKARESGEEGGGRAGEGCLLHEMLGEFGVASAMLGHACRPRGAEVVGVKNLGLETKIGQALKEGAQQLRRRKWSTGKGKRANLSGE